MSYESCGQLAADGCHAVDLFICSAHFPYGYTDPVNLVFGLPQDT